MNKMDVAYRLLITGRVQGVGYRAWTCDTARSLRLRGWVRNLTDGRVEAVAAGPEADVRALIEACHRGPTHARVTAVEASMSEDVDLPVDFAQNPTAT